MSVIANRYARALFRLSHERNVLGDVEKEAYQILSWIHESPDLKAFLGNRLSPKKSVYDFIEEVVKKTKLSETMSSFLMVLSERSRLYLLQNCLDFFLTLVDKEKGLVRGEVKTIVKLSKSHLDTLNNLLSKKLNKTIQLTSLVKPEILGGVVLRVGPYLVDSSLESRLSRLEARLKG